MRSPAAQTALGPMFIVALDQYERSPLIHDDMAYRMLPTGMKALARLMRPRLPRQAMIRSLNRNMRGGWASFLCRKRYVQDKLTGAVSAGARTVVILGAGLDTGAYRLPILAPTSVDEVDLPETSRARRRACTSNTALFPTTSPSSPSTSRPTTCTTPLPSTDTGSRRGPSSSGKPSPST